ncbi:hypothetical protein [Rhodopirellula sp. MGV]|uniref:hypothetical protein n=1 Tax=Rhodopirellula sp. MGV TaxID=2023130 RepID=UPI000B964FE1|nr:hypothetical protein [Rhodopirellula sp. MGV]OYP39188.1 hypothetical protein CGZ80_00650 [Rhodopirellula sp. MGV]PNY35435.1 hypothetical protein C2E31_18190 [Rhodopirellula baltica]
MKKTASKSDQQSSWNRFWFQPSPVRSIAVTQIGLGLVTAMYFISSLVDVSTWYPAGAPASTTNLAEFFRTAELTREASWMVSPLFIWDATFQGSSLSENAWVYRIYLIAGTILSLWLAFANRMGTGFPKPIRTFAQQGGLALATWIWFVGWANRTVLIAGVAEPLISISLAALILAPLTGRKLSSETTLPQSWRTTFAKRLLACQTTLIAVMTTATMLASPVWWNGTGAYALVAPSEDRFIDVRGSWFETPFVYECLTLILVALLPIGLYLAWHHRTRKAGVSMMIAWSVLVGILTTNVLYAATLAIIATTVGDRDTKHAPAGANGAETLGGGSMA